MSITPLAKFSKWLIIEIYETNPASCGPAKALDQPITQKRSNAPNASTAAIIWFSVRLDARIPRDTKAAPRRNRPR